MNFRNSVLLLLLFLTACSSADETEFVTGGGLQTNLTDRTDFSELVCGKTYLPVYSHIYHIHEKRSYDLTVTVSLRNVSESDTVFLTLADYYNTAGEKVREYLESPVFIRPMETLEIVISESDTEGGSGANFLFHWAVKNPDNPPLFEAVMISTYGQQGLSFTTRGVQITE